MNVCGAAIALLAWAAGQPATPSGVPEAPAPAEPEAKGRGMPERITSCHDADTFGGTETERAGWCALHSRRDGFYDVDYAQVRTLADEALRADPSSYRAHFLMGMAQHLGEANLPKSLHHLERAEALLTSAHGDFPGRETAAWEVYRRILLELVYVHGEMDHHQEKIAYVDRVGLRLGIDYSPLKAWALLKLKRWEEARAAAAAALRPGPENKHWRAIGLTAMCAIESEMKNRQAAYEACLAAAEPDLKDSHEGGVALSNAAAAALEMFRFDEAERYYIESTRREVEGTINPWGRLVHLYLRQGRFAEALSALRKMNVYRRSRPPWFDQQDETDARHTAVSLLIVAGWMDKALEITSQTVDRPDRQGTSSAASEQNEAGNLIIDRAVRLDVARRLEEEAGWSSLKDALKLRAKALKLRAEAWVHGKKAASLLADPERLVSSLRPECPGSVEIPAWLDAEIIGLVGPGVALGALELAQAEETLPEDLAGPIFWSHQAEARLLAGEPELALDLANKAVQGYAASEALLRARAAAIGAAAAQRLGFAEEALALWSIVLQHDPGLVRRLGLRLPVSLAAASDEAAVAEALDHLEGSPLFDAGAGGFVLSVGADQVVLSLPDGSPLLRARVEAGPSDPEAHALRIAKAAHRELLVAAVDVTQADIRSLDGGIGGGGRASERAKSVLEEVLEP